MKNLDFSALGQKIKSKEQLELEKRQQIELNQRQIELQRKQIEQKIHDAEIANRIIELIFSQIDICVKYDKSDIKLGWTTKLTISGMCSEMVKNGIKDYIRGMNHQDIVTLLVNIRSELEH